MELSILKRKVGFLKEHSTQFLLRQKNELEDQTESIKDHHLELLVDWSCTTRLNTTDNVNLNENYGRTIIVGVVVQQEQSVIVPDSASVVPVV